MKTRAPRNRLCLKLDNLEARKLLTQLGAAAQTQPLLVEHPGPLVVSYSGVDQPAGAGWATATAAGVAQASPDQVNATSDAEDEEDPDYEGGQLIAVPGDASTVHDRTLTGSAYGYDTDGLAVSYQLVGSTSNGQLKLQSSGSYTYTPNSHYVGNDSFTFKVTNSDGVSNVATVTIRVTNAAPTAGDSGLSAPRAVKTSGSVSGGDGDGDSLTYSKVGDVAHGTLDFNPDGTFTYTSNHDFVGQDSFTYKVNDGVTDSNTATVTITVAPRAEVITAKASVTWQCSASPLSQWLGGTNSYGLSISATTYDGKTFVGPATVNADDPGVRTFFSEKFLITPDISNYNAPGPNGTTVEGFQVVADIKWTTSKTALMLVPDIPDWIPDLFENSLESFCESKFTLQIDASGSSSAKISDSTSSPNYFRATDTLK